MNKIAVILILLALLLVGCGGSPVTMKNIPVYPAAQEISQADSQLFDGLSKIAKNDTRLAIVLGGKEKKVYRLPNTTKWSDVQLFYEKNLDAALWQLVPPMVTLVERVELPNDISQYQTALWTRGNQTVAIALATSPKSIELFVGLISP